MACRCVRVPKRPKEYRHYRATCARFVLRIMDSGFVHEARTRKRRVDFGVSERMPGLGRLLGDEFEVLYERYEREGRGRRQVRARELWTTIMESQIETGTPYMLYKDSCNRKSNQQNVGTIKSSNLCAEIIEYSSADEVAVCNVASIALNKFVIVNSTTSADGGDGTPSFDFSKLRKVVKILTRNLNALIDRNWYPIVEAERSNKRHRPIAVGVQGLADVFILMRYPFESEAAQKLNVQIFETLYYGALEASCELAQTLGVYDTYDDSPISRGILQYDMCNNVQPTNLWDWADLKRRIAQHGVRNSLLLGVMPTATTAQILGNNECIEPYTNNIFTRRVVSGEFQVVNSHLLKDLIELGLWSDAMRNRIIFKGGSIQQIQEIPAEIRALYKTVWEISQKTVINMAAARGAFIDQSQSLNIHLAQPTMKQLTSMHFHGWRVGLKTGMYYLRTRPAVSPIQFTVDKLKLSEK